MWVRVKSGRDDFTEHVKEIFLGHVFVAVLGNLNASVRIMWLKAKKKPSTVRKSFITMGEETEAAYMCM